MFRDYFCDLLNPTQMSQDIQYAKPLIFDAYLDREITVTDIQHVLGRVKPHKAPGDDRIPYEFYVNASEQFLVEVARVFTNFYDNSIIDESLIRSIIYPIHKKGNINDPCNYRAISFMNTAAKILMGILNYRLTSWVEENQIMEEYQAGFRKNYCTADNVYNIVAIVSLKLAEKKKVYAFFVDFRAAFDKVCRKSLIYKLYLNRVSSKFINMIEAIYQNTKCTIWNGEELSQDFETVSGVKQGCLLSPLLFALYLNDLHEHLEGGIDVEGKNVRVLMYADDIVILSGDINSLQNMIINLEEYCKLWNMELNMSKSKIMVFRNGGRLSDREKWFYKGQEIEIVSEYTYLGVVLTPRLSFKRHVSSRITQAKAAINSTWKNFLQKNNINLEMKWKLFQAVCRSIQGYAAQVWGFGCFDEVDKLQRYFLKRILKLPESTPNYAIDIETNVESGHMYTLQLHLNYIYSTMFKYDSNRLPNFLTKLILSKNIFWAKSINDQLVEMEETPITNDTPEHTWLSTFMRLTLKLKKASKLSNIERARESDTRIYKYLDYTRCLSYMNGCYTQSEITWILKARCDLIYLNGSTNGATEENALCTLCNLRELENLNHFLGNCPILREIRDRVFGKPFLTHTEIIEILDGNQIDDWPKLISYLKSATQYRKLIINEYR